MHRRMSHKSHLSVDMCSDTVKWCESQQAGPILDNPPAFALTV